jgi:hypothetical protein
MVSLLLGILFTFITNLQNNNLHMDGRILQKVAGALSTRIFQGHYFCENVAFDLLA